jgi:hypothetical protein
MPREVVDKHNDVLIPQGLFAQITRHRLGRKRYITHLYICSKLRRLDLIYFQVIEKARP